MERKKKSSEVKVLEKKGRKKERVARDLYLTYPPVTGTRYQGIFYHTIWHVCKTTHSLRRFSKLGFSTTARARTPSNLFDDISPKPPFLFVVCARVRPRCFGGNRVRNRPRGCVILFIIYGIVVLDVGSNVVYAALS